MIVTGLFCGKSDISRQSDMHSSIDKLEIFVAF